MEYIPTAFEVWKWLYRPPAGTTLEAVISSLENSVWLQERLETVDGHWGLKDGNSERRVVERRRRYVDALRKMKRVRRATWWFRLFPWIESVAVGNTLAWWNTKPESDIDLVIVCRPGTIWLTRLVCVTPFALLGWRPNPAATQPPQDPVCFSFFLSTDRLAISDVRLTPTDPYFAYWIRSLIPVLDRNNTFKQLQDQNAWADDELPHTQPRAAHPTIAVKPTRWMFPNGLTHFESSAKHFQFKRLPHTIREMMNQDTRVVVTDQMLKFHDQDRRAELRDRWHQMYDSSEIR